MENQFAVLHIQKGKDSGGGLGHHIDRTEAEGHSYKHADSERFHLNKDFTPGQFKTLTLSEAVNKRISEGYKGKKAIRNDATKYLATILTGSHERMKAIESDPVLFDKWIQANREFMEDEFGKDNIVRFSIHLDEKTPHIHCVSVPLTSDGRLSAKDFMNGSKALAERQTRYAEKMEVFKLGRGKTHTDNKHISTKDFYANVNSIEKNIDIREIEQRSKGQILELFRASLMRIEEDRKKIIRYQGYSKFVDKTNKAIKKETETMIKNYKETISEYKNIVDIVYEAAKNKEEWNELRNEVIEALNTQKSILSEDVRKSKGILRK